MDKQDKYDNGHADTDTVIDPFLTGQCHCCNSSPVTDLAAEVCSQNSIITPNIARNAATTGSANCVLVTSIAPA